MRLSVRNRSGNYGLVILLKKWKVYWILPQTSANSGNDELCKFEWYNIIIKITASSNKNSIWKKKWKVVLWKSLLIDRNKILIKRKEMVYKKYRLSLIYIKILRFIMNNRYWITNE